MTYTRTHVLRSRALDRPSPDVMTIVADLLVVVQYPDPAGPSRTTSNWEALGGPSSPSETGWMVIFEVLARVEEPVKSRS